MALPHALTVGLLQAAATLPDTLVMRTIPQRDLFDWTSGTLQIIVLVLGIGLLITLILLVLSLRTAVRKAHETIERLAAETRPLVQRATGIVDDALEVVAMVKTDVERITDAASLVSEQLIDAADTTSQRIDQVNAVIDVLQDELESAAIGTVSAIRGVRVGTRVLSDKLIRRRGVSDSDPAESPSGFVPSMYAADEFSEDRDDFDDLDEMDDDDYEDLDELEADDEARPA